MALGENIAKLRKAACMTQADLGKELNISAQAVSKWEKDLSEPDMGTMKKICEIFGVSMDELTGFTSKPVSGDKGESGYREETKSTKPDIGASAQATKTSFIYGYCDDCNKPLTDKSYTVIPAHGHSGQKTYCKECALKKDYYKKTCEYEEINKNMHRSWIFASLAAIAAIVVMIIVGVTQKNVLLAVLGGVFVGYAAFAMVAQLFWGESVPDCFMFFFRSFTMPGLIFSLDLDGIIWFICVKLGLMILSACLSVLFFGVGLCITLVFAAVAFPFALDSAQKEKVKKFNEMEKSKTLYKNAAA